MWWIYALLSAAGATVGTIAARVYTSSEAFYVIFWNCVVLGMISLIASKILYKQWINTDALPLGIWYGIAGAVGISCFIFALQVGGKVGPVSILAGVSPLFVSIIAYFVFKETLSTSQIIGMIMAFVGIVLVIKG